MAMDYMDKVFDIECDECKKDSTFCGDFLDCVYAAKEEKWEIIPSGGDYIYFCSAECRKKYERKTASSAAFAAFNKKSGYTGVT